MTRADDAAGGATKEEVRQRLSGLPLREYNKRLRRYYDDIASGTPLNTIRQYESNIAARIIDAVDLPNFNRVHEADKAAGFRR